MAGWISSRIASVLGKQRCGLNVLLLIGSVQETQTPYLTSIGGVVSWVGGELLPVGGLKGVYSCSLFDGLWVSMEEV